MTDDKKLTVELIISLILLNLGLLYADNTIKRNNHICYFNYIVLFKYF